MNRLGRLLSPRLGTGLRLLGSHFVMCRRSFLGPQNIREATVMTLPSQYEEDVYMRFQLFQVDLSGRRQAEFGFLPERLMITGGTLSWEEPAPKNMHGPSLIWRCRQIWEISLGDQRVNLLPEQIGHVGTSTGLLLGSLKWLLDGLRTSNDGKELSPAESFYFYTGNTSAPTGFQPDDLLPFDKRPIPGRDGMSANYSKGELIETFSVLLESLAKIRVHGESVEPIF